MGISIWQLLIVLVIIVLVFGTKKLRGIGTDLGSAVRGFKTSMKEGSDESSDDAEPAKLEQDPSERTTETKDATKQTEKA